MALVQGVVAILALALVSSSCARDRGVELRAEASGRAFGASHTNEECVGEALRLGAPSFDDALHVGASFLRACLPASRPSPGFCDGVPRRLDLVASQAWSQRFWQAHGRPHLGGVVSDDAVRDFCHPR